MPVLLLCKGEVGLFYGRGMMETFQGGKTSSPLYVKESLGIHRESAIHKHQCLSHTEKM